VRSLIWKEWHEQRLALAFGCVVMGAMALLGLRARILTDIEIIIAVCAVAVTLLPIVASTALVAGEREQGTFGWLLAMPVSAQRVLIAKALVGVVLCVVPIGAAAIASVLVSGGREMESTAIWDIYFRAAVGSVAMFFWVMALTAELPSQARAALVGLGIYVMWGIASGGLARLESTRLAWMAAVSPLGFIGNWPEQLPTLALWIAFQAILAGALWRWMLWRLRSEMRTGGVS